MNYREFGKTGEKISALGFGCMRFPEYKKDDGQNCVDQDKVDEMIAYAYENGVNYFDTAPYYCNSNSESALGHAVKNFRDKVLISTKCPMDNGLNADGYRRHLEQSLDCLGTDHVDFYHFWSINRDVYDNMILKEGLLEEAAKAKEEGLIRHISFSFHDHPSAIRHIVDTSEEQGVKMESMLCQYNLLDRSNEEMIKYVHEKGLGTVAMGPVGGGRLAAPTDLYAKLTGKSSIATYELAFKFCLGNPNLNCALSGMQNLDMVKKNVEVASNETAFSEEEWKQLGIAMEELKKFSELYCTGCKYCQPCPVEINIPRIFEMYTYYNVYDLKDHAKNMMRNYLSHEGKTYADCKNCGMCEKKCPQHLAIRENLDKVCKILCE